MKDTLRDSLGERLGFLFCVAVSAAWLILAALYLRDLHDTIGLRSLNLSEASEFLAAVGSPLAVLWLFAAVIEQRRRLSALTRALGEMFGQQRHSLQLAEAQTRALLEMQNQTRRDHHADIRRLALQDLAASAAVLAERLGVLRREDLDMAWARFGSGDIAAFVQPFLTFAASHAEMGERLAEAVARDQIAAAALAAFVRRYETLLNAEEKAVQALLDEGPLGRAFRLFRPAVARADEAEAPAPASASALVGAETAAE